MKKFLPVRSIFLLFIIYSLIASCFMFIVHTTSLSHTVCMLLLTHPCATSYCYFANLFIFHCCIAFNEKVACIVRRYSSVKFCLFLNIGMIQQATQVTSWMWNLPLSYMQHFDVCNLSRGNMRLVRFPSYMWHLHVICDMCNLSRRNLWHALCIFLQLFL